ncbi:hypothetical protein B0E48_15460 [Rhodanobacter sp. C03]|nr:acyltransferase [Rhodanobacter sp. C03]OOG53675.1 hypothetical protein B0E48_15460 [Rhodanobacter sp. C03]
MNKLDYSGKIAELEGLRGIAILMVLLHHFWPGSGGFYLHYANLAHFGWSGVDLFFVISGFLVGGILLDTRDDIGFLKNFYSRRILRIFPLYYALVIGLFLIVPVTQMILHGGAYLNTAFVRDSGNPLWYLTYMGNMREAITGVEPAYFLAPLWSISIEEQFYLTAPLVVLVLGPRRLVWLLVALMVISPLFRYAMYDVYPHNERIQYLATLSRLDNISVGVLLAALARSGAINVIPKRAIAPTLVGMILVVAGLLDAGLLDRYRFFCRIFGYSILAFFFFTLVLFAIAYRDQRVTAWLRMRWLCHIGGLCYGLYLLQRPAGGFLSKLLELARIDGASYPLLVMLGKILFALVAAELSWHFFEKRINALKSRFVSKHHPMDTGTDADMTGTGDPPSIYDTADGASTNS